MSTAQHEHGTVRSYIVGFILSLIFTFIPYYLVDNQTIHGTALWAIVLAFAMFQMLIQVTFFLHLGRGPKPRWNLYFYVATFGMVLVVVSGSILIMNNLHYNMTPLDQNKKLINDEAIAQIGAQTTGACQQLGANHQVTIKNGQASPVHIDADKCDTLTFMNEDKQVRILAFGAHPKHEAYAGEDDISLRKGRGETITLSETGSYQFHDHLDEAMAGTFTVSP